MASRAILQVLAKSKKLTLGPLIRGTGIPVPCYPDLRELLSNPKYLSILADECVQLIHQWKDVNLIAGCAMGGIMLATAVSLKTGLPMVILRKRARSLALSLIDGAYRKGQRALLIDDSIVTGTTQKMFVENLLRVKVKPVRLLAIIDVGASPLWQKHRQWLHTSNVELHALVTWTEWALYMRDRGRIPRATVETILYLMSNPPKWAGE